MEAPFRQLLSFILYFLLHVQCSPLSTRGIESAAKRQLEQNLVTWDEHSFFVRGERLFFFSGEFHPFRLPVPGLWLDVFQKIKALGFNGVSFYTDWALYEGTQGRIVTDGIWDLQPFFDAASEAGIYLIARPGPYINAEVSAGGMPGWTLRINSTLRSNAPDYLDSTVLYLATLGKIIADAQITNGGPVVLVQPENEYATWPGENLTQFPQQFNREEMAFTEQQLRNAGIVVPLINNDNEARGYWAPGTGLGSVDIYGIDAYPLQYNCGNPSFWPTIRFPTTWQILHEQTSPTTPFAIPEFQGGSGTGWGPNSVNADMCNALVNEEAVRVLWKNNYSFGVKLFNLYMTYGGTNWGNLGYMGADTSYDYGAAITEDRHVWREKYSEEKLQANFIKVSPAYLMATPGNVTNGSYASTQAIAVTQLLGTQPANTNFYIVRHADFTSLNSTQYQITIPTSTGTITIPQLGGQLSLNGRDAKVHVTDYDVGGVNLIYCTADIFTWARSASQRVLIMYGGAGEIHEFAFDQSLGQPEVEGCDSSIKVQRVGASYVVQWTVTSTPQALTLMGCAFEIRMLWRNDAYNYWVLELPAQGAVGNYSSPSKEVVIVNGGYLLRTASIQGDELKLTGDINATTDFEVVYEPTGQVARVSINGQSLGCGESSSGKIAATLPFAPPAIAVPDFATIEWKYLDSLPEIQSTYDDSLWTACDHTTSTNDQVNLTTPTSLYAIDYGYHAGSLLYRGHFMGTGAEQGSLSLNVSGGSAFGNSVWLNSTFLGSWAGNNANQTFPQIFNINALHVGQPYVITVLIDDMGQTEEPPGTDSIKFPEGILNYSLSGHPQSDITWKMTGNLGGEQYRDLARGPRNEGAMFAERQGYHQPNPPSANWPVSSPMQGIQSAGVGFYSTSFELNVSAGYDVPMSFVFNGGTYNVNNTAGSNYRVQLFVNGYQFGKYINNLGPQTTYPVPEGILNYNGINYVSLTLWALDPEGAKLDSLELVPMMPVWSGYSKPALSPQPAWSPRLGAY